MVRRPFVLSLSGPGFTLPAFVRPSVFLPLAGRFILWSVSLPLSLSLAGRLLRPGRCLRLDHSKVQQARRLVSLLPPVLSGLLPAFRKMGTTGARLVFLPVSGLPVSWPV